MADRCWWGCFANGSEEPFAAFATQALAQFHYPGTLIRAVRLRFLAPLHPLEGFEEHHGAEP